MRVPHYPTIDPQTYDAAKHDTIYGATPHRWLSAGYMGHLLCFPAFGPPSSEEEIRNSLGNTAKRPSSNGRRCARRRLQAAVPFCARARVCGGRSSRWNAR